LSEISDLLSICEKEKLTEAYGEQTVEYDSKKNDIYIVSDLHLAAGAEEDGKYSGTENFFADQAFYRFLNHLQIKNPKQKTLLINGDFIDFLRIVKIPQTEQDFINWQNELEKIGISKSIEELKKSISSKEKTYGLKTHNFKSIWKIYSCYKGHVDFFLALSKWVKEGNRIIFTKGNHDLELYWFEVRNYIRYIIAYHIDNEKMITTLKDTIFPNTLFADNIVTIDKNIYITHGHHYDKYTVVLGSPTRDNGEELNIPFGSFFNRYLINKVELNYSFVDNIRPSQNILPIMLKERFFVGLKLLFYHIPFTLRIIPKQYYRYMFSRFFIYLLAVGLPVLYTAYVLYKHFFENSNIELPTLIQHVITLGFSYLFSRIIAFFHLSEPSYLDDVAEKLFKKNKSYQYFAMGHTHNPDLYNVGDQWYYNTGTWIPIVETDSTDLRHDKTYLFTHFEYKDGLHSPAVIYNWNDDSGREELYPLIRRKE
jgi:UDP-2,3-diacylglucosamine pyrophosphatase LpxH